MLVQMKLFFSRSTSSCFFPSEASISFSFALSLSFSSQRVFCSSVSSFTSRNCSIQSENVLGTMFYFAATSASFVLFLKASFATSILNLSEKSFLFLPMILSCLDLSTNSLFFSPMSKSEAYYNLSHLFAIL